METAEHKTVYRIATNNNKVLTCIWKSSRNHAPLMHLTAAHKNIRFILYQGPKSELQHTRKTLGTLSWVFKEDDYSMVIGYSSPCSGSVSSLLKPTRHYHRLQPEQVVLRSKDSRSKLPLVTNFYISVENTKLHNG